MTTVVNTSTHNDANGYVSVDHQGGYTTLSLQQTGMTKRVVINLSPEMRRALAEALLEEL